ncbi:MULTISPECIES: hypothetical protein [unclassified Brevundimonas]|uniref:hypothetical protein n=1 Tax=unclassified Brevundimonas TaxID=2622653 RepID=UPI0025C0D964|nr:MULTISPECIES: hypothetical protein [unclassified Brevundimonas]
MGESKHTLGPWEVVRHGDDGRPNPEGGTYWVMPVAGHGSGWVGDDSYLSVCVGSGPDAPANARLIAAAPEMKEALEEVLRWDAYPNASCRQRIEAALAKANGERPSQSPTARCV